MVVGPGDDRAPDGSRLRASDTDREQVIDVLKAAFVQGRVTREELDLRVGLALRSQTYAGLDALTADIPAGLAAAQPLSMPVRVPDKAPAATRARSRDRAVMATSTFAILAWTVALFAGPDGALPFLLGTGSALVSLFFLGTLMLGSRHDRSAPRPPGQRAVNTGRDTAYRVASAASPERLPDASSPRRQSRADTIRPPVREGGTDQASSWQWATS